MRFTRGERLYPMDIEPYVRSCSLWIQRANEEAVCLVPRGELTLDSLAQQPQDELGATNFLRFTDPQSFKELFSGGLAEGAHPETLKDCRTSFAPDRDDWRV